MDVRMRPKTGHTAENGRSRHALVAQGLHQDGIQRFASPPVTFADIEPQPLCFFLQG
jgi:hypothetical protein